MTPNAFRKNDRFIARKRSDPAVSQIRRRTFLSWTVTSFDFTSGCTVHFTNCGSNILSTKLE